MWFQTNTPDGYVEIPIYNIYRCYNAQEVWVLTYVHTTLNPSVINLDVPKPTGVEDVLVKIQYKKWQAVIIGCVYRRAKVLATSFD